MNTETTRRDFLGVMGLAMVPFGLVAAKEGESEQSEGKFVCRWYESEGVLDTPTHYYRIGRDVDLERYGQYAADLEGALWEHSAGWTFRIGREFMAFPPCQLAEAKERAERATVDLVKQLLVELERFAFRLNRETRET